ncbi:MAG TPA: radical SAM protein [Steroidobacteraceae bacterium]|nr:radical SAM protein [Steroidobacteraceae bacterium]
MTLSIVLLSPKGRLYRHRSGIFRRSLRYAPLTLPTLVSLVPPEIPHHVRLIDEGIRDIPLDLAADLVGITVITPTAPRSYWLADHFRARGITVVLGGPHVTLVPEDAAPHADAIVVGYAEESWPRLLRDFTSGRLAPRYEQIPDLSLAHLPPVRRDLVPRRDYVTTDVFEATRGCAHACDFCVVPSAWGRRQLQKPVEEVTEDIARSGARRLIFVDLNLVSDRNYAARLFAALVPLGVQWYGLATSLLARDRELLELCARSGCRGLLIGLESISRRGLREVHKGFQDPGDFKELIAVFHRHGIAIQGCFVFGFDDDTPEVFERTAQFVVEAEIDLPRFAVLTPFPATPLYRRHERDGRLLTRNWELYDGQHVVFQPQHMSATELMRGTERAWKHAYRYRSIARRIWRSPAARSIVLGANLGYRFYAHHLDRFYNCDWGLVPRTAEPGMASGACPVRHEPAQVA